MAVGSLQHNLRRLFLSRQRRQVTLQVLPEGRRWIDWGQGIAQGCAQPAESSRCIFVGRQAGRSSRRG